MRRSRLAITFLALAFLCSFAKAAAPAYGFAWGDNFSGQVGDGSVAGALSPDPSPISDLGRVVQLAAGGAHALAVKPDGSIWAWGDNTAGQLGDGSNLQRRLPVRVRVLGRAVSVVAGASHSLALFNDGSLWAWGRGAEGQLGTGSTQNTNVPRRLAGAPTGITRVAAGSAHTLAVAGGKVWSWGSNSRSQLGRGVTGQSTTPGEVPGLSNVIALAAGETHSIALDSSGSVWSWGNGSSGQLGTGSTQDSRAPVRISSLPPIVAIAATLGGGAAVSRDGRIWTWGDNTFFAIGQSAGATATPTQVPNVNGVVDVAAGARHMVVLGSDGRVRAWGAGGPNGQSDSSAAAVDVRGLPRVTSIAAGGSLSLALSTEVEVFGWGDGGHGQLGDAAAPRQSTPVAVGGLRGVSVMSGGGVHSVALDLNRRGFVWGSNQTGQLGITTVTTVQRSLMRLASMGLKLVALDAGTIHSLAITEGGAVYTWGNGVSGQLGDGTAGAYMWRTEPRRISLRAPAIAVSGGLGHSLALLNDGTVQAWGDNTRGQIGDSTGGGASPVGTNRAPYYRVRPTNVVNLSGVTRIAAGGMHNLALTTDGRVWTWGRDVARFGMGGDSILVTPTRLPDLVNVIAVAAGDNHNVALKSDGTVWTWGNNASGQLGYTISGSTVGAAPAQVPGLVSIVAIAAGRDHTLALKSDGTVWAWGGNFYGQLGRGTTDAGRSVPMAVPGLTGVSAIAAGDNFNLVIRQGN